MAELRASLLRLYLSRLPALAEDDAAAIREALGKDAIRRIERAAGHEWLPMAFEVAILRSVQRRRGDDGVRALGRDVGSAAIDDAMLRPLVSAILGMLGRRPDALLQLAVAGWTVATRNAGRLSIVSRTDGEVRISFADLSEELRERALFLRMCGSTEALLAFGRLEAAMDFDWTPGAASATYVIRWRRGGRGGAAG